MAEWKKLAEEAKKVNWKAIYEWWDELPDECVRYLRALISGVFNSLPPDEAEKLPGFMQRLYREKIGLVIETIEELIKVRRPKFLESPELFLNALAEEGGLKKAKNFMFKIVSPDFLLLWNTLRDAIELLEKYLKMS